MLPFNEWMNEADYEPAHITAGQTTPQHLLAPNRDISLVPHVAAPAVVAAPKLNIVASSLASPATPAPKRGRAKAAAAAAGEGGDDGDDDYAGSGRRGAGRKRSFTDMTDGDYDEDDDTKRSKTGEKTSSRNTRVTTQPRNTIQPQVVPRGPAAATKQNQVRKEQLTRQSSAFVSNLSNAYAVVVASTPAAVAAGGRAPSLHLPHHAEWFNINLISDYEKRACPDFFAEEPGVSSKTPEIYKEYRDFMIHTYQQNPSVYLTFTACRRSLSGDAMAVKHVFDFLEYVSLINYAVAPESCSVYAAPRTPGAKAPASQHLWRTDPAPTLRTAPYSVLHAQPGAVTADVNLTLRKFISGKTEDTKVAVPICSSCRSICQHIRYDHLKNSSVTLCSNCYASGLFPAAEMTSGDFVRVDMLAETSSLAVAGAQSKAWNDDETLRLLEGIEQHGQDWDSVANHVNSGKTPEQCLAHFIRMPIEDPFLQNQSLSASHSTSLTSGILADVSFFRT